MDYVRNAKDAVSYDGRGAKWLLSYASSFEPARRVRLGLAIREPGAAHTWWQADNISALDTLMTHVTALAASYPSFDGLAVFHTKLWWAASLNASFIPNAQSAQGRIGGWYIPDEAIFNGTYQQLRFLHWAQHVRISVLYAQDYIGFPTVIPGVQNNTDAFCAFAQMAHRANVDLQVSHR